MTLILDFEIERGQRRKAWLNCHQVLQVGRSGRADVAIESDSLMADIHFAITRFDGRWQVVTFPGACGVSVNARTVQEHPLRDGDTIRAGRTEFHVTIEGDSTAPSEPTPKPPAAPVPIAEPTPIAFASKQHPSSIVEFSVSVRDGQHREFLDKLAIAGHWYGALNFVRLGKTSKSLPAIGKDLLEKAPEEIRKSDSLHLVPIARPWKSDYASEIVAACRADAGSLIVSALELPDLLESHKFVWAWHTRPSILYQQVTAGSRELAETLFSEIACVLTLARAADSGMKFLTVSARSAELRAALQLVRMPVSSAGTISHRVERA